MNVYGSLGKEYFADANRDAVTKSIPVPHSALQTRVLNTSVMNPVL
jgi:hypothetical protein